MTLPFGRALVTGGAGFIGSHIVDRLIQEGCKVVVLDDLSSGSFVNLEKSATSESKNFSFVKGSINDEETLEKALKDVEVVFHEAAIVSVPKSVKEPELTNYVNVKGTANLLRKAVDSKVERFIFASSSAVYGDCPELPLSESTPTNPISPYGSSKLAAEKLCLESYKMSGLPTTILRYFNVYGPRSTTGSEGNVVNKFLERLTQLQPPIIYGDGKASRDFIYVKDVVEANLLAAATENSIGKVYNVATGVKKTVDELAQLMETMLYGDRLIMPFEYTPALMGDILESYALVSHTKEEIGFRALYSLEEGLRDYLNGMFKELPLKWNER